MPHLRKRQVPLTAHRAVIPCRFAPMFLSLSEVSHLKLIDKPQFADRLRTDFVTLKMCIPLAIVMTLCYTTIEVGNVFGAPRSGIAVGIVDDIYR